MSPNISSKRSRNQMKKPLNTTYKYDEHAMELNPNSQEYKDILDQLAKKGEFDVHTTKFSTHNMKDINGKYVYVPKNILYKITRTVLKTLLYVFRPIVNGFAFNLKIKGRKNLKGIKSAITISNHVHYLDILMNMQAVNKKNFYVVAANHNMKRGPIGYIFKACGVLPLSNSLDASINLNRTIKEILKKGGFIHMYAESALWFRYERSRPLKIGAFKIASENNVPVVPIVILFREKKKYEFFRHKKTITIQIGKPIYPRADLSVRESANIMKDECQKYYNDTVCDFYGYDKETYSIYISPKKSAEPDETKDPETENSKKDR